MSGMSDDALADVLAFALSGRPDRVTQAMLENVAPELRAAIVATQELAASLALAEPVATPSASLRSRLLATTSARAAQKPRKAVLVCDMINDHLTPGRALEVPRARAIVDALAARLDEARAAGTAVVYVLDRHEEGDPELDEWGSHAVAGTEGAEVWPKLAPKPGDTVVTKPSMSAFFASKLEGVLDGLGVDALVLTGCATEVQLMATATDALQRGYAVELPADSQAGSSEVTERVTMAVISALLPYAPARLARLAKTRAAQATALT